MDSEVSNGSGLGVEHITDLLVFSFLQSCPDNNFYQELEALGRELPVRAYLQDRDDELQTDGNRASRCLFSERIEPDSERQEEIIQHIARRLAQLGDEMDQGIHPTLVQQLVAQFMNTGLSDEDRRACLAAALEKMRKTYPKDMEPEKATLIMTMLLAKKVADFRPSLLCDVFRTTVNFINQNLFAYVRNLVRNLLQRPEEGVRSLGTGGGELKG